MMNGIKSLSQAVINIFADVHRMFTKHTFFLSYNEHVVSRLIQIISISNRTTIKAANLQTNAIAHGWLNAEFQCARLMQLK